MIRPNRILLLPALAACALAILVALPSWSPAQKEAKDPKEKRDYGPEQATGEPDALDGGDQETAWAPLFPDTGEEWLLLEYATAVMPARVKIYENYNPGAVYKVTVFDAGGKEFEAWKGKDPTTPKQDKGISDIELKVKIKTQRVKIHLNTKPDPDITRVDPPYNEIDAVGLVDASGKTQWAVAASASSTNADAGGVAFPYGTPLSQRLRGLEDEVRKLRAEKTSLLAQADKQKNTQERQRWEYKVLQCYTGYTFTAGEKPIVFGSTQPTVEMAKQFNELAADGWEYVGPVADLKMPPPHPAVQSPGRIAVLFKRLKQ